MKPYAKLRGRMYELDVEMGDIANFLGKSPSYVSYRMTGRYDWKINEAYRLLEFLKLPMESLFEYFPPKMGMPQKQTPKPEIKHYTIKRQVCSNG